MRGTDGVENSVDGAPYLQVCFHSTLSLVQLQLQKVIPALDGELRLCFRFRNERLLQRVLCKSFQSVESVLHKKNVSELL